MTISHMCRMSLRSSPRLWSVLLLLLTALLLRVGMVAWKHDQLREDRDAYWGIAEEIAAGNGFADAATGQPTAFRPPLYPLLLAGLKHWDAVLLNPGRFNAGPLMLGLLQALLGTAIVGFTFLTGIRLGLGRCALCAGLLVCVDPLLLQYTTQAMTEVTFTFLVIWLIWLLSSSAHYSSLVPVGTAAIEIRRQAGIGIILGLGILCRPTIALFAPLMALWWTWTNAGRDPSGVQTPRRADGWTRRMSVIVRRVPWLIVIMSTLIVSPWVIRNMQVFGKPILSTTHGGYTLLLGNNPVFYREVVKQPWGTVWEGDSLHRWQESLEEHMRHAARPPIGEVERDRWMYAKAWRTIADNPGLFLRACWLRCRRFWSVAPQGPAAAGLPLWILAPVKLFYAVTLGGFLLGIWRLRREEWRTWCPLLLLIVTFASVHALYWTNMRMRAPVAPVIALFAARALIRKPAEPNHLTE